MCFFKIKETNYYRLRNNNINNINKTDTNYNNTVYRISTIADKDRDYKGYYYGEVRDSINAKILFQIYSINLNTVKQQCLDFIEQNYEVIELC